MVDIFCVILAGSLYVSDGAGMEIMQPQHVFKAENNRHLIVSNGEGSIHTYVPQEHPLFAGNAIEFMSWCENQANEGER